MPAAVAPAPPAVRALAKDKPTARSRSKRPGAKPVSKTSQATRTSRRATRLPASRPLPAPATKTFNFETDRGCHTCSLGAPSSKPKASTQTQTSSRSRSRAGAQRAENPPKRKASKGPRTSVRQAAQKRDYKTYKVFVHRASYDDPQKRKVSYRYFDLERKGEPKRKFYLSPCSRVIKDEYGNHYVCQKEADKKPNTRANPRTPNKQRRYVKTADQRSEHYSIFADERGDRDVICLQLTGASSGIRQFVQVGGFSVSKDVLDPPKTLVRTFLSARDFESQAPVRLARRTNSGKIPLDPPKAMGDYFVASPPGSMKPESTEAEEAEESAAKGSAEDTHIMLSRMPGSACLA